MYRYICNKCNKEFYTKKKNQKFCSRSCANSQSTISRKIQDNSIFMNGINELTSYILGLILSDGCLSYDSHSHRYRITISMNDYELVEFLRNKYSPTKKLYSYNSKHGNDMTYTFITTNEEDIKFLRSINVNERKSKSIRLPDIDEKYMSHLIRGVFDGDGSVYINRTSSNNIKYEYLNVSFTSGSEALADDIISVLKINNINSHKVKDSRKDISTWYVKIYSKQDISRFYKYLYKNAILFMKRKRNLFDMMI